MIAVVGGGITGMTLADLLRRNGKKVVLIEKEANLGGQCRSIKKDNISLDMFYHAFYPNDIHVLKLLKRLKLDTDIVKIKAKHGFLYKGQKYPLNSVKDLLFFPPLSLINCIKLGWTLWKGSMIKDWHSLEKISAKDWLIKTGGIKVYRKFWEPMLHSKFKEGVDNLSGVDTWDRINRLSRGNVTNKISKNKISKSRMCYLKGKLLRLVNSYENFLRDKGVIIEKQRTVEKISTKKKGKIGLCIDQQISYFEKVFCALPIPIFASMIPDEFSEYRKQIEAIQYNDIICLILILKKPLMPYYTLALDDRNIPFTAIIASSNLYDVDEFNGNHVYYVSQYFLKDQSIYMLDAEDIFDIYLKYLVRLFPEVERNIKSYTVTKIRYAEPYYSLKFKPPKFKTPIYGVYLVSGAQIYPSLPTINSSIALAEQAITKIMTY